MLRKNKLEISLCTGAWIKEPDADSALKTKSDGVQ